MTVSPYEQLLFLPLPGRDSADPFRDQPNMNAANLSMRIVRLRPDPTRTAHAHAHSAEAVFVVAGRGTLWVDGIRTRLDTGDSSLIPAGVPHATLPDPGTEMVLVCFFPHPDLHSNIEELPGPL